MNNNEDKKEWSMRKMVSLTLFVVFSVVTLILIAEEITSPKAKVTVKVTGDDGIPISDADVNIGFRHIRGKGLGEGWGNVVNYHPSKGRTDMIGIFSASDETTPNVVVTVSKSGYYESSGGVPFNVKGEVANDLLIILLKKNLNPVPMFVKKTEAIKIPALKKDVGYDLETGDWVAPYGKGKVADFIFNMNAVYESWKNRQCNCVIKFSNEKDGIRKYLFDEKDQSSYKWPYEAPEDGYSTLLEKFEKMTNGKYESNIAVDDYEVNYKANYIFRIRTRIDEKGNILEAKYGKISGDISVDATGTVRFIYYFNPSGNRSLEFDTKRNLFVEGVPGAEDDPHYGEFSP